MIRVIFSDGSCSEQQGKNESSIKSAIGKSIAASGKTCDQIVQIWYPSKEFLDVAGEPEMDHLSGSALDTFLGAAIDEND